MSRANLQRSAEITGPARPVRVYTEGRRTGRTLARSQSDEAHEPSRKETGPPTTSAPREGAARNADIRLGGGGYGSVMNDSKIFAPRTKSSIISMSGSAGTRTLDLRVKSPQLYRLSYRPDRDELTLIAVEGEAVTRFSKK